MGMTIEESRTTTPMSNEEIVENLKTMVFGKQAFERFNAKERETLDKAWNIIDQYETRLKADMVAMLEDLKDKILFEHTFDTRTDKKFQHGMDLARRQDLATIQEKINALRGEENENDD